jgi:hypothetical protein
MIYRFVNLHGSQSSESCRIEQEAAAGLSRRQHHCLEVACRSVKSLAYSGSSACQYCNRIVYLILVLQLQSCIGRGAICTPSRVLVLLLSVAPLCGAAAAPRYAIPLPQRFAHSTCTILMTSRCFKTLETARSTHTASKNKQERFGRYNCRHT